MSLFEFCDDPFLGNSSSDANSFALQECQKPMYSSLRSSDEPVCLKMKVFYKNSNRTVIHRICDWESGDKKSKGSCNKKVGSDAVVEFCGKCSTDACNKGKSFQAWSFAVVLSFCAINLLRS